MQVRGLGVEYDERVGDAAGGVEVFSRLGRPWP
jgi:hypothetical protein